MTTAAVDDERVDYGNAARAHTCDRVSKDVAQIADMLDGPESRRAERARMSSDVDRGSIDALSDPTPLNGSAALARNALLVEFVVEVRAIVDHEYEERNRIRRRGPDRVEPIRKSPSPRIASGNRPGSVSRKASAAPTAMPGPDPMPPPRPSPRKSSGCR